MSIFVAIPQAEVPAWMHRPYSEMAAAVESGALKDARIVDRELWDASTKPDGEKYAWGGAFGTFQRMRGWAIFRDGSADLRRDGACLWFQGF